MSRRNHRGPLIPPNHRQLLARQRREFDLATLVTQAEHLHRTGSLPDAVVLYYALIKQLGPNFLEHPVGRRAGFLAGLAAYQLRIYGDAIEFLEAVRAHEPNNPDVHYNLGLLYHAAKDPARAAASYRYALALKPTYAAALNTLGNALRELGDADEAEHCYQQLIASDPEDPHARYNLAHVLLLRGDLARGFRLYEDRWRVDAWNAEYGRKDILTPRLGTPQQPTLLVRKDKDIPTQAALVVGPGVDDVRWGVRLFVHQEQGLGDTLQFVRYLPKLLDLGFDVTFEAPRELGRWFRALERPGLRIITRGEPIPEHDLHVPLLSLPAWFGIATEADIPPILELPVTAASPLWTDPADTRPVVGVCFAGNAMHHNDHHRSCPVRDLAAVFARPNTRFVCLQVGERAIELLTALPQLALGEGSEIVDVSAHLSDFEVTAALLKRCDAVVTVDTSIAHLGGTLGVRTLVLTSWLSEWRWQLERTDSPWYPSVHLVRQPSLGDWPGAAAEARALLEDL